MRAGFAPSAEPDYAADFWLGKLSGCYIHQASSSWLHHTARRSGHLQIAQCQNRFSAYFSALRIPDASRPFRARLACAAMRIAMIVLPMQVLRLATTFFCYKSIFMTIHFLEYRRYCAGQFLKQEAISNHRAYERRAFLTRRSHSMPHWQYSVGRIPEDVVP